MDISKIMDLFGLGDDKAEDLETEMEKQILPEIQDGKVSPNRATAGGGLTAHSEQPCAWCDTRCHPDQDGFHLVHIAMGAFQERHSFCCDDCYEAFRRMYPARVHRNCYERPCEDCNYCIKRYAEEADGLPVQDLTSRPAETVTSEKA